MVEKVKEKPLEKGHPIYGNTHAGHSWDAEKVAGLVKAMGIEVVRFLLEARLRDFVMERDESGSSVNLK